MGIYEEANPLNGSFIVLPPFASRPLNLHPHFRYAAARVCVWGGNPLWNDSEPLFLFYPDDTEDLLELPLIEMPSKKLNTVISETENYWE